MPEDGRRGLYDRFMGMIYRRGDVMISRAISRYLKDANDMASAFRHSITA